MKVFICYRRKDSHYIADHIYEWIEREFGPDHVFKDTNAIRLGWDYRQSLQEAVARCDVLLAVIGPRWLDETDPAGRRLVSDPEDWVRIEVETALERDIPLIPLLVGGASFPRAEDLPPSLYWLVNRQGMPVRPDPDFRPDMERLINALRGIEPGVSLGSKDAYAYCSRGNAWCTNRAYDKAIADYDEAIRLDPNCTAAYYSRGNAWKAKQAYDKAIADYDEAIHLDPKFAQAYNNRGNAWCAKQAYDKAIADYNEAIRLDPNCAAAYCSRGLARKAKGM